MFSIKKRKPESGVSSQRAAAIAARILRTGRFNEADVRTLAGSVLTQAPAQPKKKPKRK